MEPYQNTLPEYLTTPEAAKHLRCSKQFLEIARHRGVGPRFCRLGRAIRYRRNALDDWMRLNEVGGAQ
jgi:excisionase family DNA binding protein